jgi:hypothetical protein
MKSLGNQMSIETLEEQRKDKADELANLLAKEKEFVLDDTLSPESREFGHKRIAELEEDIKIIEEQPEVFFVEHAARVTVNRVCEYLDEKAKTNPELRALVDSMREELVTQLNESAETVLGEPVDPDFEKLNRATCARNIMDILVHKDWLRDNTDKLRNQFVKCTTKAD